jgi:transcription initiation factor TFIID subunit TAF12
MWVELVVSRVLQETLQLHPGVHHLIQQLPQERSKAPQQQQEKKLALLRQLPFLKAQERLSASPETLQKPSKLLLPLYSMQLGQTHQNKRYEVQDVVSSNLNH